MRIPCPVAPKRPYGSEDQDRSPSYVGWNVGAEHRALLFSKCPQRVCVRCAINDAHTDRRQVRALLGVSGMGHSPYRASPGPHFHPEDPHTGACAPIAPPPPRLSTRALSPSSPSPTRSLVHNLARDGEDHSRWLSRGQYDAYAAEPSRCLQAQRRVPQQEGHLLHGGRLKACVHLPRYVHAGSHKHTLLLTSIVPQSSRSVCAVSRTC